MRAPSLILFPYLVAMLSGLLLSSAFPPVGHADAAWFALMPLLLLLRHKSPRQAFWLAGLAGFIFWLTSLGWLWRLIANGGPPTLVIFGHGALAAYCALYMALFGAAVGWLWHNDRLAARPWTRLAASLLIEPLLWVGSEELRGLLFSGFPWNSLGISQYRNIAILQCASVGGVAALSALLVAVNGGVASMLERTWRDLVLRRRIGAKPATNYRAFRLRSAELTAAMLLALLCFVWGLERVRAIIKSDHSAPQWRVALIHPDAPSIFERGNDELTALSADLLNYSALAATTQPDLCLWPETILPGPLPYDAETIALASNAVALVGAPLLAGGLEIEPGPGWEWQIGARYYNSLFLLGNAGLPLATYRKQHLVPFGEYIPLESLFPLLARLSPIGYSCTPGASGIIFDIAKAQHTAYDDTPNLLRLAPLICFEDIMPYLSRRAVKSGATMLANFTNDAWFDGSAQSEQHLAQAVFRAVENGVPMARCANSGVSCLIDATGRVTRRVGNGRGSGSSGFICDALAVAPTPYPTIYRRYGALPLALPSITLLLAMLGWMASVRLKERRRREKQ